MTREKNDKAVKTNDCLLKNSQKVPVKTKDARENFRISKNLTIFTKKHENAIASSETEKH